MQLCACCTFASVAVASVVTKLLAACNLYQLVHVSLELLVCITVVSTPYKTADPSLSSIH